MSSESDAPVAIDAPEAAPRDMSRRARLLRALAAPVDAAGLHAFRIAFGVLICAGAVRFAARGWIRELYVDPPFHFHYWGFGWIEPLPPAGMVAAFVAIGVLGLLVASGRAYRPATLAL